ncbi:hypothetical protein ACFVFS_40140 [Kitasatospora sp. NPDC057692]|uniref:hypothetical protein n=1 Tax=Kitasatospora sp. NPDC057692 TaxID=3346215 RepID=UPI0036B51386
MQKPSQLTGKQFNGYLRVALPHKLDEVVEAVVVGYMRELPSGRQEVLDEVGPRAAGVLNSYAERMASIGVRTTSVGCLERGIVAIGMATGRLDDPRDSLIALAALNHSATMLGSSLERIIAEVSGLLPAAALSSVRAFVSRREGNKSLSAMRLRTTGSGSEFRYVSA